MPQACLITENLMMKSRNSISSILLLTIVFVTAPSLGQLAAPPLDLKQQAAKRQPYGTEEMLLAAARAGLGERRVAVGDHGIVLLSDDGGRSFRQAKVVPTRATLNAVSFTDERNGWAAGHWGTILHTTDGGENWTLQRTDTATDRPLFSIHFSDVRHGVAVGLWSLLLVTQDGGQTWTEIRLQAPPDGGKADRNLFGLFSSGKNLYVAAERGIVLRSSDHGVSWSYLNTAYKGSFWTGIALRDGTLLVGGLRGTLYRSVDEGKSWKAVENSSKSSITGIIETADSVIAVGLDGVVLRSVDQGQSFSVYQRDDRMALTSVFVDGMEMPVGLSKHGIVSDLMPVSLLK